MSDSLSCKFCGAVVDWNNPGVSLGGVNGPLECTACTWKRWKREDAKKATLAQREEGGQIVRVCPSCKAHYEHPDGQGFAENRKASDDCTSGKRDHCTCDTCF